MESKINALKETDLIFGKFDATEDFTLINHMLLLGKFYLYSSRCQKTVIPNLPGFIAKTKALFICSRVPETTLPLETTLRSVYMEL